MPTASPSNEAAEALGQPPAGAVPRASNPATTFEKPSSKSSGTSKSDDDLEVEQAIRGGSSAGPYDTPRLPSEPVAPTARKDIVRASGERPPGEREPPSSWGSPATGKPLPPTGVDSAGKSSQIPSEGVPLLTAKIDGPRYTMPRVGERFPTVDAVRTAGSFAAHQLGYSQTLYSHPTARTDGSYPDFQLVCNHGRHLAKQSGSNCPAQVTCKAIIYQGGDKKVPPQWEVKSVELKHNHPPKFGSEWKPPRSGSRPAPKAKVPTSAPASIGSRSDSNASPAPLGRIDVESSSQESRQTMAPEVAESGEGDNSDTAGQETGSHNFSSEELIDLPVVGTTARRDNLQNHIFKSFHQRGYYITVFQSPVAGTKRLLGLGCTRSLRPYCPFRIFAGPVDYSAPGAGFQIVSITGKHNHVPTDQGEWVPRKARGRTGAKKRTRDDESRDGTPDDEREDEEEENETHAPPPKAARTSSIPSISQASSSMPHSPRIEVRIPWLAQNDPPPARPTGIPPPFYFNQTQSLPPPVPHVQTSSSSSRPHDPFPSTAHPLPNSRELVTHPPRFSPPPPPPPPLPPTPLDEWRAYLTLLDPSLLSLAERLADPSLGCTPASFFAPGADDHMRMELLARVEGVALWPRMRLMDKIAKSGVAAWEELVRAGGV